MFICKCIEKRLRRIYNKLANVVTYRRGCIGLGAKQ